MKKARLGTLLVYITILTCACGGPSLRYKKEIHTLLAAENYEAAAQKLEEDKNKIFSEKNAAMYYMLLGVTEHDAGLAERSSASLAKAQEFTDFYYKNNILQSAETFLINDEAAPYIAPDYERALTYYYRAFNFLDMQDMAGALVEARRAVFFLDNRRAQVKSKYTDDPFVQYFASLLFESEGNRSSARIARENALNAYENAVYGADTPDFYVPQNADKLGEIIFVHYNGNAPVKISKTFQVAWGDVLLAINETSEDLDSSPQAQNSVISVIAGDSITVAYPALQESKPEAVSSRVFAAGGSADTILASNITALARLDLEEKRLAQQARMIARAAVKRAAAVTAKKTAEQAAGDEAWGDMAKMLVNIFNTATEKADTRSVFTLPAEIRLARMFVEPGIHDIVFKTTNAAGHEKEEKVFKEVKINAGQRIWLHHRTAR